MPSGAALLDGAAQAGIELPITDYQAAASPAGGNSQGKLGGILRPLADRLATRQATRRRALGAALDLTLLSTAIGLVLALGFVRGSDRAADPPGVGMRQNSQTFAPIRDPTVGNARAGKSAPSKKSPSLPPSADKYESLRKAWGG
ncbi:MAG: hypothetical protein A2150_01590 [Candidatus Muproteobacteria bacterium RBG_16_64_11]|uniref:Uncharacterized protein n=1 Tax=Candidatus Muproteobacteria bacterium RBG_16_64_11 TaxID=1817758 RepID=A0A1F6TI36_9PROT|nr:MAG: hypothetical protein A2150_01590 [Candidatus Muproteobacteria bacterium RBG_16_64_11]